VLAIIVDKLLLLRRTRRAMDRFDEAFWSGNSLEDLYAKVSERPTTGTASLFVAAMREWKRSIQNANASFMGLQTRIDKVLDVSIGREVEKLESNLLVLATVASASPSSPLRHGMGHHDSVSLHRGVEKHLARRRGARHRRGFVRDRHRPLRGHSGADRYNKLQSDVVKSQSRMETFADEFSAILSRQIDQNAGRDRAA